MKGHRKPDLIDDPPFEDRIAQDALHDARRHPDSPGNKWRFYSLLRLLVGIPAEGVILLVRIYQLTLSRLWGPVCRFHPSCSQYFILAVRKYGLFRGGWRGVLRILRCHPFHPGGYDPP